MTDKRQKNQLKVTFQEIGKGEAPPVSREGIESEMATIETENLALEHELMKEVLDPENLKKALKQVMRNKGAAGIDGMTVEQLPQHLRENWKWIKRTLQLGTYAPKAVRKVEIPKQSGGMRQLGIPTVLDRFVQQALLQVMQRHFDPTFSQYSYGFRPGKSAHQAIQQAQQYVCSGLCIVVDIDLEKFFDRVNHDVLMGLIAKRVEDRSVRKLIRAFLNAGIMEDGLVKPTDEGTPQGGPLSPFLSNIMLDELDRELEKRRLNFIRYADDCNIYVRSERAGNRVMASITRFINKRLRLQVNEAKSAVARPWKRKFLGFSLTSNRPFKRRIAPQAIERFKAKIRELTRRTRGETIERIAEELSTYLTGWRGYFRFCETPSVLKSLEKWVRRRLRSLLWKRWKRGTTRYAEMRERGLTQSEAVRVSCTTSPWRASKHAAMNAALPNAYFKDLGIPPLWVPSGA